MKRHANIFEDKTGLDRIIFFSDAVMAIAITLLLFDLNLPVIALPRIIGYLLSFAVIGIYWEAHHRTFRSIRRYDRGLIWFNLMYLFFVALMPFSSRLISFNPLARPSAILYAINVALLGVALLLIFRHANSGNRLVAEAMTPAELRRRTWFAMITPILFSLSIGFSFVSIIVTFVFWFLALLVPTFGRRWMKII